MIKVGLTGGIGSGKSTISNIIKNKNIPVIDADIIAREVMEIYPEILGMIKKEFGENFFDSQGALLRRKLGNFIFENKGRKKKLEDIIIPYIKREIFKKIEEYNLKEEKICVIDAPTLIENGLHSEMDVNILVWVDRDTQIDRVSKRDLLSNEEISYRINSQMPLDNKKQLVDYVIDNGGSLEETRIQVEEILEVLGDISSEK